MMNLKGSSNQTKTKTKQLTSNNWAQLNDDDDYMLHVVNKPCHPALYAKAIHNYEPSLTTHGHPHLCIKMHNCKGEQTIAQTKI